MKDKSIEAITKLLEELEFECACELEINNINYQAENKLIYNNPINLN
jgi:ketopantoate reductase